MDSQCNALLGTEAILSTHLTAESIFMVFVYSYFLRSSLVLL